MAAKEIGYQTKHGLPELAELAALDTWKRLLAWVGLPGWLVGLWWFRPPPRPAHLEEL